MHSSIWHYPKIISHRGGGALTPENTLAGLRLAARLGFRAVEFDVMLSADGVPVLIHDETLERTTEGTGSVAEMPLVQLCRLDAGYKYHRSFFGEPLPTLDQALSLCLELGLSANVEIKPSRGREMDTGKAVAHTVLGFVERLAPGRVVEPFLLSSFSSIAMNAARTAAPTLPRAMLVEEIPDDWQKRLQDMECCAVHCAARYLSPDQATEIKRAGIPLACYTVNLPIVAAKLFSSGVTAIFSDRLDLFDPVSGGPVQIAAV